jgi:proline iminopeptidase
MKEQTIETPRGKIWCAVYGEEKQGVPLLVVHGGPGFVSMPRTVSDFAADRPVIFYDQLRCGRSDRAADKAYSLEAYVDELDRVRRGLGLGEVILLGFSWGCGLIASYVLDRNPDGVRGIILSGPLLSSPRWGADQRGNIATMPEAVVRAIEEGERSKDYTGAYQTAVTAYYQKFVCNLDPWPDDLTAALDAFNLDVYMTMWGPSEFTVTGKLKDFDLYPRLANIKQPVLLTCGDSDEAGVATVKLFQTAFANAYMAVIPNATHMHHIEQPALYKAAVGWFLNRVGRKG